MQLAETPETVTWPETHYAFVVRIGPFMNIAPPAAWQSLHAQATTLSAHNQIMDAMALYKAGPQVYRAGFMLAAAATRLPNALTYERFSGSRYRRFVLTGPYSELPEGSGRVWKLVAQEGVKLRDDFAIENYVNDPNTTPAEELITEILVPVVE